MVRSARLPTTRLYNAEWLDAFAALRGDRGERPIGWRVTAQRGGRWSATMLLGLIRVLLAVAFVLVLWWVISAAWVVPPASTREPPKPPAPVPAPSTAAAPPATSGAAPPTTPATATAADIARLNDTITKLTTAVEKLNQQLASPGASPKPKVERSRQEVYEPQTWRSRERCWW
jgi:hypothetical protein